MTERRCRLCELKRPIANFHSRGSKHGVHLGYRNECRECVAEYNRVRWIKKQDAKHREMEQAARHREMEQAARYRSILMWKPPSCLQE